MELGNLHARCCDFPCSLRASGLHLSQCRRRQERWWTVGKAPNVSPQTYQGTSYDEPSGGDFALTEHLLQPCRI